MYYDQPITNADQATAGTSDTGTDEPYPGVTRTTFEARRATVTAYVFRPGARFPVHHHPQEQITVVQRGHVEMTVGDEVHALSAGEWSVVAPGVEHGVMAGPDGAELLAVIVPRREHPDAYDLAGGEAATR